MSVDLLPSESNYQGDVPGHAGMASVYGLSPDTGYTRQKADKEGLTDGGSSDFYRSKPFLLS